MKEPITLLDVYWRGLHTNNSEAKKKAAAAEEPKKAGDWRDVVDDQGVSSSHKHVEVPEVKERHMLQDLYRLGLHDDNSEAKKDISWW
ncbi:MAG: hypothetical protein Q9212_003293 [Teloschistes hypoglaucus]